MDLPNFTVESAKELIPKTGPRVRFLAAAAKLKENEEVVTVPSTNVSLLG